MTSDLHDLTLAQASARLAADEAGIAGVSFIAADATDWAQAQPGSAELVIVNPPRRGIGAALCARLEAAAGTRWLIYSSCNAESLARDLAALPSFRPQRARVLDMFPQTRHCEVIVLLERSR